MEDLISAKVEAAAKSKQERSTIFINVYGAGHKDEGDCYFSKTPRGELTQAIYTKGSEVVPDSPLWGELMATGEKISESQKIPAKVVEAKKETTGKQGAPVKTPKEVNKKEMAVVKTPAKKIAKKVPAKKVTAVKKSPGKVLTPKTEKKDVGEKLIRGNNMALTPAEWRKVDELLKKEDVSFSTFSRNLVLAKIK